VRLLLLGYFGFGNAGDEALLAAEVEALRSVLGPSTEFLVVSGDPAYTQATHDLPAVSRTDVKGLVRALAWCDGVIAGGGSLLQDVTSARPVAFYAGTMLAARLAGKPVFVYAQGLGPLRRRINRRLAGMALRSSTYVAVRDAQSLALAHDLGARGAELTADPVLGWGALAPGDGDRLAVALRPWDGLAEWLPVVRAVLSEMAREVEVVLVPFHAGQDVGLARELASVLPNATVVDSRRAGYRAAIDAVASARAVLGMRLHALVVAAAAGRPFVALSYDPKVSAFATSVGAPVAATLPGPVDVETLVTSLRKALQGPDQYYLEQVERLRATARRPAREVAERLGGGDG
jgi:polysaccharide pyruvyl transferase CsaB